MSKCNKASPIIGCYLLLQKLGSGSFASVYKCEHTITHQKFAGKLYDSDFATSDTGYQMVRKEISILQMLVDPRVVYFREAVYSRQGVLIVMELVEGRTLLQLLPSCGGIPESFARAIFTQIVEALAFLHCNGIVHRDLKLENVMIQQNGVVKLIDFGLAEYVTDSSRKDGLLIKNQCGTVHYYAPEMIMAVNQESFQGSKVDIWAVGVLLYCLVSGFHPFNSENENEQDLCNRIVSDQVILDSRFSMELKRLLRLIFRKDPTFRASLKEIKDHPWTKGTILRNGFSGPKNEFSSSHSRSTGRDVCKLSGRGFVSVLDFSNYTSRTSYKVNGLLSQKPKRLVINSSDEVESAINHNVDISPGKIPIPLCATMYESERRRENLYSARVSNHRMRKFTLPGLKNHIRKIFGAKRKSTGAESDKCSNITSDEDLLTPASAKHELFQESIDGFEIEDGKLDQHSPRATRVSTFFKVSFVCWGEV